ncbi:MAG TPA: cation:proton antiporter [Pyrinomonadaceae bacterium]|nr:cation:proton antiporter [Pyrinomonadaceae bacterium]
MPRRAPSEKRILLPALAASLFVSPLATFASGASSDGGAGSSNGNATGLDPSVLLSVALMLFVAKVGGELFAKFKQPAVLGELAGGIALGSLSLFGVAWVERLRADAVVAALAEIGIIVLLFEVGLESNVREMMSVGWTALLVSTLGVVATFGAGLGASALFLRGAPVLAHVFVAAALCATSVGITARVLRDLGRLKTREAGIILGAAVIDDVMGLLILAVVAGAIRAAGAGASLALADVGLIALKSVAFLVVAVAAGHYVVPHLARGAGRFKSRGVLVTFAVAFCFLTAWASSLVGLAPVIGAFAAGLVLDEIHFEPFAASGERKLAELLAPVGAILVPIFFVLMGLRVDLRAFGNVAAIGFALALTAAAVFGKLACSLGVGRGANRLAVGVGMIPRGEVSLIFAGMGATLALPGGQTVVSTATFGAVVIMVAATTLVTPPALKWALRGERTNAECSTLD